MPVAAGRNLVPQSTLARQVAILGLVLCAIALSIAFPLRSYLQQRSDLAEAVAARTVLEKQRDELVARKAALQDPDYIAIEARRRLQFVSPGDTVFVVHAPPLADPTSTGAATATSDQPWYENMWATLSESAGAESTGSGSGSAAEDGNP